VTFAFVMRAGLLLSPADVNRSLQDKAKVAPEATKGEATVAEMVSKHGVHQTLINTWRRQAVERMAGVFSNNAGVAASEREGELEKLHAKIGQLVVERDFLAKACGR